MICREIKQKIQTMFEQLYHIEHSYFTMDKEFKEFIFHNIKELRCHGKITTNSRDVYFWITPWGDTPIPWYTLILAIIYKKYASCNVKIVLNDMWMENHLCPKYKYVVSLMKLKKMFLKMYCHIETIKLSEIKSKSLTNEEIKMLREAAKQNTVRSLKTSAKSIKYNQLLDVWYKTLLPMAKKIKGLLERESKIEIVIPGGGYEETGFLCQLCTKHGVLFSTFDSGIKSIILGIDCIATWQGNTEEVCEFVNQLNNKDEVVAVGFDILNKRMDAQTDIAASYIDETVQTCKRTGNNEKYDIVIFPNIEHDTASLGTHLFFNDYVEWLTKSIKYILNETSASVAVREHPMQRKLGNKQSFSYLQHQFDNNGRFKFYECDEAVNSYDLIANAKLVIVSTSTIGMEAAMMGKKVITISNVFYGDADFCIKCDNERMYFQEIERLLNKSEKLEDDSIDTAAIYYVLTQMCNWALTDFTPYHESYLTWTKMKVRDILNYGDTKLIFKALINRQPLALLVFRKKFAQLC